MKANGDRFTSVLRLSMNSGLTWNDECPKDTNMPRAHHIEHHFTGTETIHDIVIGMSDGLTVPFALAAGLSGAVNTTRIIVTAGLAEIAAGSIAMGLGGYLAAKSDAEHDEAERKRKETEVEKIPEEEVAEFADIFKSYRVTKERADRLLTPFATDRRPGLIL
jgi:vacuolar iron transporter family protein